MDFNMGAISGLLSVPPELIVLDSGAAFARYLVIVKSDHPAERMDVLPVVEWEPPTSNLALPAGTRVVAVGSFQRRFFDAGMSRRSRLEFVASTVKRSTIGTVHSREPEKNTPTSEERMA